MYTRNLRGESEIRSCLGICSQAGPAGNWSLSGLSKNNGENLPRTLMTAAIPTPRGTCRGNCCWRGLESMVMWNIQRTSKGLPWDFSRFRSVSFLPKLRSQASWGRVSIFGRIPPCNVALEVSSKSQSHLWCPLSTPVWMISLCRETEQTCTAIWCFPELRFLCRNCPENIIR